MEDVERVRLWVTSFCGNCGFEYKYVDEYDSHDLHCPYPNGIRLRFVDDGDPVAEVGDE